MVLFFTQLNVWLKSAFVCINFYFLLRMGPVILILLLLNNFGFNPRCFLYSILSVWILFYSSEECCFLFLCFQVLHWLDSNCKICLSGNFKFWLSSLILHWDTLTVSWACVLEGSARYSGIVYTQNSWWHIFLAFWFSGIWSTILNF